MSPRILLPLVLIALILVSCSKSSNDNIPTPPVNALLKSITELYPPGISSRKIEYTYDNKSRLIQRKITYLDLGMFEISYYEYLPSHVAVKQYLGDTLLSCKSDYLLNAQGLATIAIRKNYFLSGDSSIYYYEIYEYRTDGFMIKWEYYSPYPAIQDTNLFLRQTWQSDGINLISSHKFIPDSQLDNSESYIFIPGSINTIGWANKGMSFFGKSNQNLIATSKLANSDTVSGHYAYTFDSLNRVTKMKFNGNTIESLPPETLFEYY